jgi:hypothetical protein
MGREGEVPCDAVYAAKNDTEDGEDDHAGVFIAFGAWSVESRNVSSTRRNFVGCNDLEGGSEGEGGNEEDGEEWAEDEEEEERRKKEAGMKKNQFHDEGKYEVVASRMFPSGPSCLRNIGEWNV